jgi:hypothetical protein
MCAICHYTAGVSLNMTPVGPARPLAAGVPERHGLRLSRNVPVGCQPEWPRAAVASWKAALRTSQGSKLSCS